MSNHTEPFIKIANELDISRYINETDDLYFARVVYSSLGIWLREYAAVEGSSFDQAVSKGSIHRNIKSVLDSYIRMNGIIHGWFSPSETFDPINAIRDVLIKTRDIYEIGYKSQIITSSSKYIYATSGFAIQQGFQTEKRGFSSGLAWIVPSPEILDEKVLYESVGISCESKEKIFDQFIRRANWHLVSNINEYEVFDVNTNTVISSSWSNTVPPGNTNIYIVRRKLSYRVYDYKMLRISNDKYYLSDFSDYSQHASIRETQRLLYIMKALFGKPARANVNVLDKYTIFHFWSKLPPAEDILMKYIGYPLKSIANEKNEFVVRNELVEIVNSIMNNLGIERRYYDE